MKKRVLVLILLAAVAHGTTSSSEAGYEQLKALAEQSYTEGSYRRAHQLYIEVRELDLSPQQIRWVEFRIADSQWRAEAATETIDKTRLEEARRSLEALAKQAEQPWQQDRVWAEAHESLGDFWWSRLSRNWGTTWIHYQKALNWWAGSKDLAAARRRYLEIIWTISEPRWRNQYDYGSYWTTPPPKVLENALKIARDGNDKARLHYLMGVTLGQVGDWNAKRRVAREFEAALFSGHEWYDDALFQYAQWMTRTGYVALTSNGQWTQKPDYVKALQLYQQLVNAYSKGQTPYYDQAQQQIKEITSPYLGITVSNVFLPSSEIQFYLNWRNMKQVDLSLYSIDLVRDIDFERKNGNWLSAIAPVQGALVKSWSEKTGDQGDHARGTSTLHLDRLPTGTYLLEASAQGKRARDLILVTDTSLVLKTQGDQVLAYYCNALDGSPIGNAKIRLWRYSKAEERWRTWSRQTDSKGLALFDLEKSARGRRVFAFGRFEDRQAFSLGRTPYHSQEQEWRIYAFTDRPAYRPGEEMHWKIVARRESDSSLTTPVHEVIEFDITDPRGTVVKKSKATLNNFGSAWGALQLTDAMTLGEYSVQFWDQGRRQSIGSAKLFRLEEYKLPEFRVSVESPETDGKQKVFRLGDRVEVAVQVNYYFGSPATNSEVEVLVHQRPFHHRWQPQREFPWLYEEQERYARHYGGWKGQLIQREKRKTDFRGKAVFAISTPTTGNQDFEYEIEARVTDSSRREVIGRGVIRVTRQPYFVYLRSEHNLYRPQDTVEINIKTLDTNNAPLSAQGKVKLQRSVWEEVWIDPRGREVKGERLRALKEASSTFPPTSSSGSVWRLKHRGYRHEDILTRELRTNQKGEAQLRFTPERDGYYRVSWTSFDEQSGPLSGETTVWVATGTTTELGYRQGGLDIVLDKDTFRVGQTAPVMLTTPASNRYVLLTVEAKDLSSYQLIHVTGTAKLVEVPILARHVPNLFLEAMMVSDYQMFVDAEEVIVPPLDYFLQVEVETDKEEYQPRQKGKVTIRTTNSQGKPVSAEVALSMVDESVFAIQQEYASDPRQFFHGRKNPRLVQTSSSLQQKGYVRLVRGPDDGLIDERRAEKRDHALDQTTHGAFAQSEVGGARYRSAGLADASEAAPVEMAFEMAKSAPPPPGAPPPSSGRGQQNVVVRSDFRATAFWRSHVVTGADGVAVLTMQFPDSLTSWRTTVRAVGTDSLFGVNRVTARTDQPLIVRLQAPRFFLAGDQVTVSAVINNNTEGVLETQTQLDANGLRLLGLLKNGRLVDQAEGSLRIQPGGQDRVNWVVSVEKTGRARLAVVARSDHYADAMEGTYPVYEHGVEKFISRAGKVRSDELTVQLDLPSRRKPGSTQLSIQITPSLAVTMLDALPYLIDYPYGCTEQTMSRFLPAAITARTLQNLGISRDTILERNFGGIVEAHASETHPRGAKDLRKLDEMISRGLGRLYDFQHTDGGWGWWKEGESDHFMTAYVVWGLTLADEAGIAVQKEVVNRAVKYLDEEIIEAETAYDLQAWMLHALSSSHRLTGARTLSPFQQQAFENLWKYRDRLNAYTRALLALSAHHYSDSARAATLVRNLENGVKVDRSPQTSVLAPSQHDSGPEGISTAHWGEDGFYWRWSEGGVEATALALRAMLAIDPDNELVEPVTNWLIKNRRGAQWSNTRDTAIVLLTLNDYLRSSGELEAEVEFEVHLNDRVIATRTITPSDVIQAASRWNVNPGHIQDGINEIRITKTSGHSPLYFAVQAEFFSLEEPVSAAGNEIFVQRSYYRLVPRQTLLNGYVDEKQPLRDGGYAVSGERIEVVMTLEAKNNYEYLVFEDLKPAGLESVVIRSGGPLYARELKQDALGNGSEMTNGQSTDYTGRERWVYRELRDRKVALFIDKLPQGLWEIRYQLRAEVPGHFHALPVLGHAMYVPEIRCNSQEIRIEVKDEPVS